MKKTVLALAAIAAFGSTAAMADDTATTDIDWTYTVKSSCSVQVSGARDMKSGEDAILQIKNSAGGDNTLTWDYGTGTDFTNIDKDESYATLNSIDIKAKTDAAVADGDKFSFHLQPVIGAPDGDLTARTTLTVTCKDPEHV